MPYVITEACVDVMDRTCVDQCPVDCIQQGERMLYVNPVDCIDCGACEPVCPQNAIYLDSSIPSELGGYLGINADFYISDSYGPSAPGAGAAVLDHPAVAALPRRAE
jgi:NAD-dependent dihydropyrimidine dehydrogenase PreA subunit